MKMNRQTTGSKVEKRIRVQIVQPVIPHYRVALFDALARDHGFDVCVSASPAVEGIVSCSLAAARADLEHPSVSLFGDRIRWQRAMKLRSDFVPGDVLVLPGNPRYLSMYPLLIKARRRGVRVVSWGHRRRERARGPSKSLGEWLDRAVDVVLLYTDAEREAIVASGHDPDRVFAINNTIDPTPIRKATAGWSQAALRDFIAGEGLQGRKLLLFSGRLIAKTRLDVALRALAEIRASRPEYVLAVVGDGPEKEHLTRLAVALGVAESVRWLGPIYDEDRLAPWFLSAKCMVYPGAIGLALLHAFAYGLPVVTHDRPAGLGPEIHALRSGENGICFRDGDARNLARQAVFLSEDSASPKKMREEALRTIATTFSFDQMVFRFASAIHAASRADGHEHLVVGSRSTCI